MLTFFAFSVNSCIHGFLWAPRNRFNMVCRNEYGVSPGNISGSVSNVNINKQCASYWCYTGLPMYTYINGTGVTDGVAFHQIDFMSLDGQTITSLPLQLADHYSLYNTTFAMPPHHFFYIKVCVCVYSQVYVSMCQRLCQFQMAQNCSARKIKSDCDYI